MTSVRRVLQLHGHLAPTTHAPPPPTSTDDWYTEAARHTSVAGRFDVIVVGGGPAGLSAAVASARAGARTVLLERSGCFGGTITNVGMETLGWYRYEGSVPPSGLGEEMERLATQMQHATTEFPYNDSACLDADHFKLVADDLVLASGVVPRLHTTVVDVVVDVDADVGGDGDSDDDRSGNHGAKRVHKRTVSGVITESKSGRQAWFAGCVIDCTGDADVAHLAGAPCRTWPVEERLGVTTVFGCAGVDKARFIEYATVTDPKTYADWSHGDAVDADWHQTTTDKERDLRSPFLDFAEAKARGLLRGDDADIAGSWSSITDAGEATNLNLAHMKHVDATNADHLTWAEMHGRKKAMRVIGALRATIPGSAGAKLRTFASTVGVRDTRKIVGDYALTHADVTTEARFDDAVGLFPEFLDGYGTLLLPTTGRYFQVPRGCMLPQGVEGLLVAGRCVAGDKLSHAAMRNMMACTVTGQGAGVVAAVAARYDMSPRAVPITAVHAELEAQGVRRVVE